MDITLRIGGEAGQGLQFIGSVLARIFSRYGLNVFTHQDYMSRIRGGHNFYQIRVADSSVSASKENVDILLALDENTIHIHREHVSSPGGIILHDADMTGHTSAAPPFVNVPFLHLAEEEGVAKISANSAAIGAILGILNLGLDSFLQTVGPVLGKKKEKFIDDNYKVACRGWDFVSKQNWPAELICSAATGEQKMLVNGNQAIGFGALASGCKFYAAYPMTPSTGVMIYLASKAKEYGIIVEQAEDEIAAINMALGASFGGVRAMTGTSGGGFALMTEGLSLAGMTELPVVIAEVQRPGPATGLPTRTEQSDLLFVLHGGHGEFPRLLFTPGTPEQAVLLTNKAFELAEKYQVPAIIQSDQYLADTEWTYEAMDTTGLSFHDFRDRSSAGKEPAYKRYAFSDNGVSPLAVPGFSANLVVVDSDEHDEEGHIIEDGATRNKMVEKRWHKKFPALRDEIAPPLLYGHDSPKIVLTGFGSTYGIMREAVDSLRKSWGISLLHFSELCPFPDPAKFDFIGLLAKADLVICVENNATGQFARLLRAETGFACQAAIRKYDGRPFLIEPFLGEINEHLGKL